MMSTAAVLLVTWFLGASKVNSQQVQFDSMAACEVARGQVLAEGDRLAKARGEVRWEAVPGGHVLRGTGTVPVASAVCVGQQAREEAWEFGVPAPAGGEMGASVDACVSQFVQNRGDLRRQGIAGREMDHIPDELLGRDLCAPGQRWVMRDLKAEAPAAHGDFPPPPADPHDQQQMDAWRDQCLEVKSGHDCWREEGRLSKLPQQPN